MKDVATHETAATQVFDPAYTKYEFAELLKVCPKTVDRYIAAGKIRAVRLDRKIIIPGSEAQRILGAEL